MIAYVNFTPDKATGVLVVKATYAPVVVGYETVGALGGVAALELAEHWMPDVAILDLNMPDATGLEVATLMRSARLDWKLVALSGRIDGDRLNRLVPPFDHAVLKGDHVEKLLQILEEFDRQGGRGS